MLIAMSPKDSSNKIDALVQVPKLIAHYRRHASSFTHGTRYMAHEERGHARRTLDGITVPWIYDWAKIPDQYVTRTNLSKFVLRRHLREGTRALFQRNWRTAINSVKRAFGDRVVRKAHLLSVPIFELFSDRSTRATLGYLLAALGRSNRPRDADEQDSHHRN